VVLEAARGLEVLPPALLALGFVRRRSHPAAWARRNGVPVAAQVVVEREVQRDAAVDGDDGDQFGASEPGAEHDDGDVRHRFDHRVGPGRGDALTGGDAGGVGRGLLGSARTGEDKTDPCARVVEAVRDVIRAVGARRTDRLVERDPCRPSSWARALAAIPRPAAPSGNASPMRTARTRARRAIVHRSSSAVPRPAAGGGESSRRARYPRSCPCAHAGHG
jgi:hypothetical protein